MKELFQRNTNLQNIKVCQDGDELVIFYTDNKYSKVGKTISYRLPAKYIYCLQRYEMPFYILKEVNRLLQIEKDSNIPPAVNTDNEPLSELDKKSNGHVVDSVGEAPLASVLSEQTISNPSDIVVCGSGVNPPPVAVSSYPVASDTLFILSKYPQACSQCHSLLSDINTSDLNPICNACLWFSDDVDETDLYEDDRDKTYPLEPPKLKTKPSCLAVLS